MKGFEKLTEEQQKLLLRMHKEQTSGVAGLEIVETWTERGVVCARLADGEWYHYTENNWY